MVASLEAWLSVADTVVEPPFSEMESSATESFTVGAATPLSPLTEAGKLSSAASAANAAATRAVPARPAPLRDTGRPPDKERATCSLPTFGFILRP